MSEKAPMLVEVTPTDLSSDLATTPQRAITFRAIILGLLGVGFINSLAPFNDYVLNNTYLVDSHLPTGLLFFYAAFVMLINGPLNRFFPRWVFSRGELSVALSMTLVGCALPSVGLMRYLPGHLAAMFYHSSTDPDVLNLMRQMKLPDWLFPHFLTKDPAQRGIEPVIQQFYNGAPLGDGSYWHRLMVVPWRLWVVPAVTWGILIAALFGAVILLAILFRRQWTDNERLPFPLASVFISLVDPPQKGKWVNELFRSRLFWIAAGAIFVVHAVAGLHLYFPRDVPDFPLRYDLRNILTEGYLKDAEDDFKYQGIFIAVVGLAYFVRSSLTFSMWFIFVLVQIERIAYARNQSTMSDGMADDQMFGAILPIGLSILFVGRHHLKMVAGQMFRGRRNNQPREPYLPYALVGWGLLACIAIMLIWLVAAGASFMGAVVIVALVLLVFLVLMRIVAETGMLYVLLPIPISQPWIYLAQSLPGSLAVRTTVPSFFFSRMFFSMFLHDTHESLPGFVPNALRMGDMAGGIDSRNKQGPKFIACLCLALVLAFVVSGASTLWIHYNYSNTLDPTHVRLVDWGAIRAPKIVVTEPTVAYLPPANGEVEAHSHMLHFSIGIAVSSFLSIMRLRIAGWPLEPLGYLLCYTFGLQKMWFSVFLGWLAKTLLLRLGGSSAYRKARPAFIGIIMGECGAVAFWLVISFTMAMLGHEYHPLWIVP